MTDSEHHGGTMTHLKRAKSRIARLPADSALRSYGVSIRNFTKEEIIKLLALEINRRAKDRDEHAKDRRVMMGLPA